MDNSKKTINLFVPGRLCLIGEHSDWAGLYKTINSEIIPGHAIVTGIEQGIYARAVRSDNFSIDYEIDEFKDSSFDCPMDSEKLKVIAKEGGFFSYCAGVASYINEYYNVGGVHITVTKMDLPIKSGLSSSAAICVLVARAFNLLYNLNSNTMGEMFMAYYGEQRTPSRCGRLDQACAYGVKPVAMTFEGNEISVKPLTIKSTMYFVIADLKSHKDTVKILADLNRCYPFAENDIDKEVHTALGSDNERFIKKATELIETGDNEAFGRLMIEFQENFDKKIAPACPTELKAPVLHSILNDKTLKNWTFGAKGVGSQGDGTVQLLAKDESCQNKIVEYLKNEKQLEAFTLTLRPPKKLRKAVIPVAGFGTRLFPATKCIKKDFFPVMDVDGTLKPLLLILLEQLIKAGIEEICLVIGEGEQALYESFFRSLPKEHYDKLPDEKKKYEDFIQSLQNRITYVIQKEKLGFGHAVFQCSDFAAGEPVLLLLGDMIYYTSSEKNCMVQMIETYEQYGKPIISIHEIPKEDVIHYGILTGNWDNKEETVLKLKQIIEKPSVDYAKDYLSVPTRKNKENYYAVFGQYILTKEVFEQLKENIHNNFLENGEIQLTSALEQVREKTGMLGFLVNGKSYDVGIPEMYVRTMETFGKEA
ncbi:MAG: hypothetical protein K5930_07705 [Treponemataceae bacterium]|nr:hypothetical protein [Treponemataceae bacterium]